MSELHNDKVLVAMFSRQLAEFRGNSGTCNGLCYCKLRHNEVKAGYSSETKTQNKCAKEIR
jgi:hypothetical protein